MVTSSTAWFLFTWMDVHVARDYTFSRALTPVFLCASWSPQVDSACSNLENLLKKMEKADALVQHKMIASSLLVLEKLVAPFRCMLCQSHQERVFCADTHTRKFADTPVSLSIVVSMVMFICQETSEQQRKSTKGMSKCFVNWLIEWEICQQYSMDPHNAIEFLLAISSIAYFLHGQIPCAGLKYHKLRVLPMTLSKQEGQNQTVVPMLLYRLDQELKALPWTWKHMDHNLSSGIQ